MKNADLHARVDAAAGILDQRWIAASRRIGAPMPQWLGAASGAGAAGGLALLAYLLPKPLRKMALSSATPLLLSRLFK